MLNAKIISFFKIGSARGFGAISLLLFTSSIAVSLDQVSAGNFFFSQAVFLLAVVLVKWGADFTLCKNLASLLSKSNNRDARSQVFSYLVNVLLHLSRRYLIVAFFLEILDSFILNGAVFGGLELYIALFCNAIIVSLAGIFQAKGMINTYVVYQSVLIPLLASILNMVFGISSVEMAWLIICAVSLSVVLIQLLHLNHIFKLNNLFGMQLYDDKIFKFISKQSANVGADQLITAANKFGYIIAIGIFLDPVKVTYFTVVQRFSMVISFVLLIINAVYAPRYAILISDGQKKKLNNLFMENNKIALFSGLVILGVMFASSGYLAYFYTIPYIIFLFVFLICSIAELVNVFTGSSGLVLQLGERSRFVFLSSLIFTSFGLVMSVFASLTHSLILVVSIYAFSISMHNLNCFIKCRNYLRQ